LSKLKYKKICSHCGTENIFSPSKIDKSRKSEYRKKCSSCKKRFKVHFTHEEIFKKTDILEQKILDLIKSGKANFCKKIASELKLPYSKIWRKLKLLENSNKVELDVKSSARFYKIGKGNLVEFPKKPRITARLHNIKWKVKLYSEPKNYPKEITPKIVRPKGWIKKIFILDKWKIEVNLTKTANIVFDYTESVFTDNLLKSMEDLKENCRLYRDVLVNKFGFNLDKEITYCGDPSKPKEHASINLKTNLSGHNITIKDDKGNWTIIDESPPINEPEVESSAKTIHNLIHSGDKLDEINNKIEALTQRIEKFENSISRLVDVLEKNISPGPTDLTKNNGKSNMFS